MVAANATEKHALSAVIEEAVQEAIHCLDQGLEPKSPLAWALWTLHPEEMQVVSFSITAPDLQNLMQNFASYQNNLQALCERSQPVEKAIGLPLKDTGSSRVAEEESNKPALSRPQAAKQPPASKSEVEDHTQELLDIEEELQQLNDV